MIKVDTKNAKSAITSLRSARVLAPDVYDDLMKIIRDYETLHEEYYKLVARDSRALDQMTLVDMANDLCRQGRITDLQRVSLLGYLRDAGKFDKVRAVAVLLHLGYIDSIGYTAKIDVEDALRQGYVKDRREGK